MSEEKKLQGISLLTCHLYFKEKPEMPPTAQFEEKLLTVLGNVDIVSENDVRMFALLAHEVTYEDDKKVPAQIMITSPTERDPDYLTDFIKGQFWDFPGFEEVLKECKWQIFLSDFLTLALHPHKRADIFSDWLEIALELFPSCEAVYFIGSEKLLSAAAVRANPYEGPERYLHGGLNGRYFKIQGTDDIVVDTLGMHVLDYPDVQYHCHGLEPNDIVNHAYNLAFYQFKEDVPIESGHTVQGLSEDQSWVCQYEESLIEPRRALLDVNTGEYASGRRDSSRYE